MYARLLLFVLFFVSWTFVSSINNIGSSSNTGSPFDDLIAGIDFPSGIYFPSTTTNNNGPCGRCGEKAIQGKCCGGNLHDDGLCWCTCNTGLDCPLDAYCYGYWCLTYRADQTCGGCGKPPINDRCCLGGSKVKVQKTDLCMCYNKDPGCVGYNVCKSQYVCCKNGECDSLLKDNPCGSPSRIYG